MEREWMFPSFVILGKKFKEMLVVAFVKRWNVNTDWKLLKLEAWVSWVPKSELISAFEFQLKFPFWKPVSCKRLAWL